MRVLFFYELWDFASILLSWLCCLLLMPQFLKLNLVVKNLVARVNFEAEEGRGNRSKSRILVGSATDKGWRV